MADELLERKQYLLGVTIIEGRQFAGKDAAGTSDPYVKIKAAGQVQQTSKKYDVNSATWNQALTFPGLMMNKYELETFELNLEVFDHNAIVANELIGQYSVGLSTLYRNLNHEFYKTWVGLFDRDNPNVTRGYLQFSCFIIGPNERPPVHAQDEDFGDDVEAVDSDEDDEAIARRIESIKRAQGIMQVATPDKIDKSYQMTVIVARAEGLPKMDSKIAKEGTVNPFVSARINGCVLTTGHKNNAAHPKFNSKLQFPIFYPILNNKITMRIWSKQTGLKANTFIASIPEHPDPLDQFNLTKLMTQDGRMKARWINLYGLHPLDRKSNTKSKKEGSQYLGRVLVAFNLVANDRPQLQSQIGNQINDPKTQQYQLWVDMYKLVDCDVVARSSHIWAVISIGPHKSAALPLAWVESKSLYKYRNSVDRTCQVVEDKLIDLTLPADQSQLPDIFIDIYTKSLVSDEVRIAYLRVKTVDCISTKSRPTWYRLRSPYNDAGSKNIGSLQANIQVLRYDKDKLYNPDRKLTKRRGKQQYKFFFHILSGFELATGIPEEKLNTRVQIKIGNLDVAKDGLETQHKQGHYPIWNVCEVKDVSLELELAFEADMRITIQNEKKGWFGGLANQVIGEFCVPVQSIMTHSEKPQFFNLINEEGTFMGQLLANFYLKVFVRDPKTRKRKDYVDPAIDEMKQSFIRATQEAYRVNIKFALLGIRNLIAKAKVPKVRVRLTDNRSDERTYGMHEGWKEDNSIEETANPNIGEIVEFKDVVLANEPLCWPYLQVQISDESKTQALISSLASGCEDCFTTISLIEYAEDLIGEYDTKYAQLQLSRNQGQLLMVQKQIQDKQFLQNLNVIVNFNNLAGSQADENDSEGRGTGGGGPADQRQSVTQKQMQNGQLMNVLGDAQGQQRSKGTNKDIWRDWQNKDVLKDEVSYIMGGSDDGAGVVHASDEDSGEVDDEGALIIDLAGEQGANDLETGVIVETEHIDIIQKSERDKKKEEKVRQKQIDALNEELTAFKKKLKTIDDQVSKDKVRFKMMEITDEIEALRNEDMDEDKFWGMLALNDEVQFDYGRNILKEGTYETQMKLPYEQFPLFTKTMWHQDPIQSPIVQVSGILRSGNLSGATIKGKIKMSLPGESDEEEEEEQVDEQLNPGDASKAGDAKGKQEKKQAGERWEQIMELVDPVALEFPFKMIQAEYLEKLVNDSQTYVVRVYLISAQNLTATGVALDLKSRLAGMTALCTANPYPVIQLKGAKIEKDSKQCKQVIDRDLSMTNNLNPQFFRAYELDAQFPEESQLEIKIMDKSYASYADSLIGSTTIDLENRLFSNLLYMNIHSLEIEKKNMAAAITRTQKLAKKDKKLKKKVNKLKEKLKYITKKEKEQKAIEQILIPVEFRELSHPVKSQAQGIVEIWAEIYDEDAARRIEGQKMQTIKAETFEIRLVLWETRDVPLVDGDNVDIWVRVTYDPTGRPEDEVEKRTDVHNNSKTGWGQFNWRFKFLLTTPCEFPRIKFTIHDEGVIVDEAIGEATLNLKRTISKVQKEGFIEVPKTYITCANANMPGEDRGNLMFSMTILTKDDADDDPVGESWDEPNHDPFLKKPTAGRGLGNMLSTMGFGFDFAWNPFGKFLPVILCLMVFLTLLTIFMYGKMLGFI